MTIEPDRGENVLWSGAPIPIRYALRKGAWTFFVGIWFFGFSIFWVHVASGGKIDRIPSGFEFWMFGIPFVVVGACLVLSPIWYFVKSKMTTYTLTDQRAVIERSGLFPQRISVPLDRMAFVDLRASANGPGDVLFYEGTSWQNWNGKYTQRDGFIAISEAARVEQLLRAAQTKAANGRPQQRSA
jgi:hypothetical protein